MLECIKQELLKARANIEALKQSEIANQKAKANIEVIDPECQRPEEEKNKVLTTANEAYNKQTEEIIKKYDLQKAAFKETAERKIEEKVEESFKVVLDNLDKQLATE